MYGRLNNIETARWLIDKSPHANLVSWTMLTELYIKEEKTKLLIDLFHQMVKVAAEIDLIVLAKIGLILIWGN